MNIEVIFLILIGICVLFLMLTVAVLYGMDLGIGWCDNFIDWVKKEYKLSKEIADENKAERAFLKANPLCRECQNNGKYRRAEYCNHNGNELIPACREHFISMYARHQQEEKV